MTTRLRSFRRRSALTGLAGILTMAVLAACSGGGGQGDDQTTPPASTTTSTTAAGGPTSIDDVAQGPQPPKKGVWVGAWVKPDEMSQAGRTAAVTGFESALGRPLDIVHIYHDFDEEMPTESDKTFADNGATILLSWAGADTRSIQQGTYDDVIKKQAAALKGWDAKILLEWRWEMDRLNLQSQIWSAQDYIAAWKHIRAIFAAEGATNVGWVWCPLAVGFDTNRSQPFYPGDDQVDWVCADVYPGNTIKPFETGAASFLNWAKDHPKPIIIGEFGIKQARGEETQEQWLNEVKAYVPTVPQIKALVYFNADNSEQEKKPYNMSLLSSPTALAAFKSLAADPYFDVYRKK